ncbi:unnamed protein product [Phytophthora fragariaefolia]|uniref:Unnamed protein product n=1 Tax=Phytophthora fragariaefolia TaxID=1490495 RepID=A0A9W6X5M6_9STRA|nr:unnamed protein product [Phytophthora fragariaefolia]
MARGQSPLVRAQARALRALSADTSTSAASPETSASVMAPPTASPEASRSSLSRPPPAGVAEASAPTSPPTASRGDTSGACSESSSVRPDDALSPVLGVAPRSAADAPEAAPVAVSAGSQPQGSVSNSGVPGDGTCSAADAPEASSATPGASRFSSVRWEDIDDIVTAGCWVALGCRRCVGPIPHSPAPWENELTELRGGVASLEARLAASEASLRREVDLRLKVERLCNQASHERNAALENLRRLRFDHADAARQLVATNIALKQSSQATAILEQCCCRLDKSLADTHKVIRQDREKFNAVIASYAAQLRQLREFLEQSDRQSSVSGGASSASASAMLAAFTTFLEELCALQLAIPPPPAAFAFSEASVPAPPASSGTSGGVTVTSASSTSLTVDSDTSDDSGPAIPSSLHKGKGKRPAKPTSKLQYKSLAPKKKQQLGRPSVDLKAQKAAKQAASAAASGSGSSQSVLPSSPVTTTSTSSAPVSASPASSTASTASLPSTPVVSRGVTPGTEASVPGEIDDDGGSGTGGAASEASVALGGVFASPVVSQPRRDGRPTRSASTTAGLRSMAAAENEAAPDALVLGLATPSRTPAVSQASVASSASTLDPADPRTGPVLPARAAATPAPWQASAPHALAVVTATLATIPGTQSTAFEPVTAISAPIQGPQPRESPFTFGADGYMPDKPISIRASGLAIVVKLWRQLTGRAVGRAEHSDLGFALWERAHWISVAAVEQWLQQLSDRIGSDTPEYLETEAAWRAYNKTRNLRVDRLRLQICKRFWDWCTPDAGG